MVVTISCRPKWCGRLAISVVSVVALLTLPARLLANEPQGGSLLRQQALALLLASHPRVGAASQARVVPYQLLQEIIMRARVTKDLLIKNRLMARVRVLIGDHCGGMSYVLNLSPTGEGHLPEVEIKRLPLIIITIPYDDPMVLLGRTRNERIRINTLARVKLRNLLGTATLTAVQVARTGDIEVGPTSLTLQLTNEVIPFDQVAGPDA